MYPVIQYCSNTVNCEGKTIASGSVNNLSLSSYQENNFSNPLQVNNPVLWSIEEPYLYKLITSIVDGETLIDQYETKFGIRTIRFDAKEGFFLNGKHVKIMGTNNHQDHAGVGAAMPDALQDFRINLKGFWMQCLSLLTQSTYT
ncbi:MAG: hypothetical protein ABIN97_00260 [Ginsengibacter sp.]